MKTYKIVNSVETDLPCSILSSDGWSIPFDEANTDYQAYLAWLDEGNTPEPADEVA
jgi:hypothetical protein